MLELNKIYCMDNVEGMKLLDDNCIDLVITSPPYADFRQYHSYSWDFDALATILLQKLKPGGVVVWVVGDKTTRGSEECVPYKQVLRFKELGYNIWDSMIFHRYIPYTALVRYNQDFEFMFVLSKGKVKTFNPLKIPKIYNTKPNQAKTKSLRQPDGRVTRLDEKGIKRVEESCLRPTKTRGCIWHYDSGYMHTTEDKEAYEHPAMFPEQLVEDHLLSWSLPGDLIVDPFMGSGTVGKVSVLNNRNYIGFDVSQEYCDLAERRIAKYKNQPKLEL
jgi:site-specific DNA-methyltransferase (adenine-specific)